MEGVKELYTKIGPLTFEPGVEPRIIREALIVLELKVFVVKELITADCIFTDGALNVIGFGENILPD